MKTLILALSISTFAAPAISQDLATDRDLPRYADVSAGIARSGRPTENGVRQLADRGFKTVIDLEDVSNVIQRERGWVEHEHMEFVSSEMGAMKTPSDLEVDRVLAIMRDSTRQPVLVHCQHGQDRTGLIIGLYRVLVERVPPEQAWREMLDHGFHPMFFPLTNYFKKRTGWKGLN